MARFYLQQLSLVNGTRMLKLDTGMLDRAADVALDFRQTVFSIALKNCLAPKMTLRLSVTQEEKALRKLNRLFMY